MPKILLIFSMIINMSIINNKVSTLEKIEWNARENIDDYIFLNITFNCPKRDVITLKIKHNDSTYESSLIIEGHKQTKAKIPFFSVTSSFLEIETSSYNQNEKIGEVKFQVYPKVEKICNLNKTPTCISEYPTKVIYENDILKEYKSKISLNMSNLELVSFNNLIPVNLVSLYFENVEEGDAYLYLKEVNESLFIFYDDKYTFPLKIKKDNKLMKFNFSNNYYIDDMNGITYEDYKVNTRIDSNILLPYKDEIYEMELVMYDLDSFLEVKLAFKVITAGKLIGNENSKYEMKRNYI